LRLPDKCPACGTTGLIRVSSTIVDQFVVLSWWCSGCGYDWPIQSADREIIERRQGQADRRRATRSDRRGND
jgi:hypothetical protein